MEENKHVTAEHQARSKQPIEVPQKVGIADIESDDSRSKGAVLPPKSSCPEKADEWHFYASQEKHIPHTPVKYRKLYQRAWAGHSRKAAIRAHCLECVGWLSREVELCTGTSCALYQFRLKG